MVARSGGGQLRNSVSINTTGAITGKIDRFRGILSGKCHTISLFSIPATKPRFNIYGWNVRRCGWFKVPDVEIVPRRFSDPTKVMSVFTFYVPVVFFRGQEKILECTPRWAKEMCPQGARACSAIYFSLYQGSLGKYFLFIYLRRFDSFDIDCNWDYSRISCLRSFILVFWQS